MFKHSSRQVTTPTPTPKFFNIRNKKKHLCHLTNGCSCLSSMDMEVRPTKSSIRAAQDELTDSIVLNLEQHVTI